MQAGGEFCYLKLVTSPFARKLRLPMVIRPRIRGFVCVTAHPHGCAAHIQEQIDYVRRHGPIQGGPKNVLVIGASTGYGLASRITAAFGSGAKTLGVFFERPSDEDRPATAGWYNSIAFTRAARAAGLYAANLNGDAFTDDLKRQAIEIIRREMGPIDLVVYSLASPRRIHPRTGVVHRSVLKPVEATYTNKTVDPDTGIVSQITIEPATEQEIADTIAVMGGEDWEMWMQALDEAGREMPGDVAVVGYDDLPLAAFVRPSLTTVRTDPVLQGQEAVDMLMARISGEPYDRPEISYETRLVIRKSCGHK